MSLNQSHHQSTIDLSFASGSCLCTKHLVHGTHNLRDSQQVTTWLLCLYCLPAHCRTGSAIYNRIIYLFYPFHLSKLDWAIAINIIPRRRTMYWLLKICWKHVSLDMRCIMSLCYMWNLWWEFVTCGSHVTLVTHEYLRVLHAERPAEFFLGRSLGSHMKSKHELSENEIFCWWQKYR